MLRVTIELVPHGVEALAKTISEVCIANVGGSQDVGNYEVGGYQIGTDKKITEFAVKINNYERNEGALKLVGDVLLAPREEVFESVRLAEKLLRMTRLVAELDKEDQQ